ncbi:hypothetical protein JCM6294_297 [Bacteroides pyogenes DSM 20611 = JCM 6294]|uniref:Uncharacterized protein n=2 Tax=Bacteroides pyogenes TaxID=310300 RepID=W4PCU4_9BACE|nr:hypothetical protein JCM6294_297 [Bacteroides pyogenes DSM 20611 = JCM 6294]
MCLPQSACHPQRLSGNFPLSAIVLAVDMPVIRSVCFFRKVRASLIPDIAVYPFGHARLLVRSCCRRACKYARAMIFYGTPLHWYSVFYYFCRIIIQMRNDTFEF